MKKLFLTILVTILMASTAMAADVVITITIPDAYVTRLQTAVEGGINCNVMDETGQIIIFHQNIQQILTQI